MNELVSLVSLDRLRRLHEELPVEQSTMQRLFSSDSVYMIKKPAAYLLRFDGMGEFGGEGNVCYRYIVEDQVES